MHPAGDLVRAGVARADRLRRSRETARQVWRAAPIAAAIALALAGGSRWAGWPVFVPLGALALGGAALVASVYTTRRDRAVSDAAAAAIDAQAGLGGELRSAHWFSARDTDSPWVDLHLGRAATHVDGIDWVRLYPAVRARRAKIASAAMALGALALALSVPGTAGVHAGDPAIAAAARAKAASITSLSADLQKELEDLLAAAEAGTVPDGGRTLTASELRTLLSRIAQLRALQAANDGKAAPRAGARTDANPDDLEPLAERLKRASEMASLSPEVRDAFEDLAEKLGDASDAQAATPKDPKDATASADPRAGSAAQSKKAGDKDEMSIQSVKDASAGGGAGVIMMSNQDAGGGKEAGLGLGGSSEQTSGRGRMADLGAALRKETIEAKTDNPGENVETAIRRKTERGDATVAYTRTAPRAFERGRSSAPPAVPEGRRAGVHSYFIRKQ